jgi:hypothetical protein
VAGRVAVRVGRVAVAAVRVTVKLVFEPSAPPLPPPPPQAPSRKPATPASAKNGPIRTNCRRVVRRPDITLLVPRVLPCHIRCAGDSTVVCG